MREIMAIASEAQLPEQPRPMPDRFYHATPARNLSNIQAKGLVPTNASSPHDAPRVYLARQQSLARNYAENGFGTDEDEPWVVLAIQGSLLELALLASDLDHEFQMAWPDVEARGYTEEDEMENRIPWWVSFEETGQCVYLGVVPPAAISVVEKLP